MPTLTARVPLVRSSKTLDQRCAIPDRLLVRLPEREFGINKSCWSSRVFIRSQTLPRSYSKFSPARRRADSALSLQSFLAQTRTTELVLHAVQSDSTATVTLSCSIEPVWHGRPLPNGEIDFGAFVSLHSEGWLDSGGSLGLDLSHPEFSQQGACLHAPRSRGLTPQIRCVQARHPTCKQIVQLLSALSKFGHYGVPPIAIHR